MGAGVCREVERCRTGKELATARRERRKDELQVDDKANSAGYLASRSKFC